MNSGSRANTNETILDVKDLKTYFYTEDGVVKAVDGVDFSVKKGEVLGLVGESGCGKSVSSFSILRLVSPPGRITGGEIIFEGKDILKLSEDEMVKDARRPHLHDLPAAAIQPQPGLQGGRPGGGSADDPQGDEEERSLGQAVELLTQVGIPDPAKKAECLSA